MKIIMAEHSHYRSLYRVGCHHLADYLASQEHELLYISGPMNIFNLRYFVTGDPSVLDLKYGLSCWLKGGVNEKPNLRVYAPLTLVPIWRKGIFASCWVAHNTLRFTLPNLIHYINRAGFGTPEVLMVSQPFFAELMESIPAQVKVYRLTDDIDKFPNIPASVHTLETEATRVANTVVVTSKPLVKKVQDYGVRDVHYIPNGVDYDHYQQSAAKPSEYSDLSGPIVVYIGAIDTWFDIETLVYCAEALPQVHFILIGVSRIDLNVLNTVSNVLHLGRRDYSDLPAYLQHANAGIIPFKITPLIESVSPLKLYEYMACGLPVVTSRWRELEHIDSPAHLADGKEQFLAGIKSALSENGVKSCVYREYAAHNSWQRRGQQLASVFRTQLEARGKENAGD